MELAIDESRVMRQLATEMAGEFEEGVEETRGSSWFPVTRSLGGMVVACDCSVSADDPTPIRRVDLEDAEFDRHRPVLRSLGELVELLIAFDQGVWYAGDGQLKPNPDRMSPAEKATGILY